MTTAHQQQFEVEVRGKIPGDFAALLARFRKIALFTEEKNRLSLLYFTHPFSFDNDVRDLKEEKIDLRLRITNKRPELILKYGSWGGTDHRQEISIPVPLEKFADAVELLRLIGWTKCFALAAKTFVFTYKQVEFSLVHMKGANYFEAEMLTDNTSAIPAVRETIIALCKELQLELFTEEEFYDLVNHLNMTSAEQLDLEKTSFRAIQEKYREYF